MPQPSSDLTTDDVLQPSSNPRLSLGTAAPPHPRGSGSVVSARLFLGVPNGSSPAQLGTPEFPLVLSQLGCSRRPRKLPAPPRFSSMVLPQVVLSSTAAPPPGHPLVLSQVVLVVPPVAGPRGAASLGHGSPPTSEEHLRAHPGESSGCSTGHGCQHHHPRVQRSTLALSQLVDSFRASEYQGRKSDLANALKLPRRDGQGRRRRERSDGLSFTRSRTTRASPCNSLVRSCTWEMQLRTRAWGQVPEVTESIGNFRSANFGKFLQLTKLSITAGLPIPWFGILK